MALLAAVLAAKCDDSNVVTLARCAVKSSLDAAQTAPSPEGARFLRIAADLNVLEAPSRPADLLGLK